MTTHPDTQSPVVPGDLFARHQVIAGLRELADFLEANPQVPVNEYGWQVGFYPRVGHKTRNDAHQRAEVDRIAALLDVTAATSLGGHYVAARTFGRITYKAVHIPARAMAEREARDSYADNIRLDPPHKNQSDNQPGSADEAA